MAFYDLKILSLINEPSNKRANTDNNNFAPMIKRCCFVIELFSGDSDVHKDALRHDTAFLAVQGLFQLLGQVDAGF